MILPPPIVETLSRLKRGPGAVSVTETGNTLLVFIHIPKTAGTSFNNLLKDVYGNGFVNVCHHARQWQKFRGFKPGKVQAVSGHYPYGWHAKMGAGINNLEKNGRFKGRDIRYIAVVREPLDRLISFYHYATSTPKHRLYNQTQGMGPEEFFSHLDGIGDRGWQNQQARQLGGLDNLEQFFGVAPLSGIDAFVEVLGKALGWPCDIELEKLNVVKRQKENVAAFDKSYLRDQLLPFIQKDFEVYERVCRKFTDGEFEMFD